MTTTRLLLMLFQLALPGASRPGWPGDDRERHLPATQVRRDPRDEANVKVGLMIGSARTSSRRCSARSTPSVTCAAGYDVVTKLDLAIEQVALVLEGGDRRLPSGTRAPRCSRSSVKPDAPSKRAAGRRRAGRARTWPSAGWSRSRRRAVHVLQRGRRHQGDRRSAWPTNIDLSELVITLAGRRTCRERSTGGGRDGSPAWSAGHARPSRSRSHEVLTWERREHRP